MVGTIPTRLFVPLYNMYTMIMMMIVVVMVFIIVDTNDCTGRQSSIFSSSSSTTMFGAVECFSPTTTFQKGRTKQGVRPQPQQSIATTIATTPTTTGTTTTTTCVTATSSSSSSTKTTTCSSTTTSTTTSTQPTTTTTTTTTRMMMMKSPSLSLTKKTTVSTALMATTSDSSSSSSSSTTIVEEVMNEMKKAMKAKDTVTLNTIRLIRSSFANAVIDLNKPEQKDYVLTDDEARTVLKKLAKMRKESIDMYEKAGANDRADIERKELHIIEQWLPKPVNEETIRVWVQQAMEQIGTTDNMGKVMGILMKNHKDDNIDGSIAQRIVKEEIAKIKK